MALDGDASYKGRRGHTDHLLSVSSAGSSGATGITVAIPAKGVVSETGHRDRVVVFHRFVRDTERECIRKSDLPQKVCGFEVCRFIVTVDKATLCHEPSLIRVVLDVNSNSPSGSLGA